MGVTLKDMAGRPVFSVGNERYLWRDVVLGARLRGDWADLERRTREGVACVGRMEEEELVPDETDVEAAADRFRYERKLLSADETESWLSVRGLDVEAWLEWVLRSVLRERWAPDLRNIVRRYRPAPAEVARFVWTEGVCSGELSRFAEALAGRAAVSGPSGAQVRRTRVAGKSSEAGGSRGRASRRAISEADRRLLHFPSPSSAARRIEQLERLETGYRRFVSQLTAPENLAREVAAHPLDWLRFDLRSLLVRDDGAAREVALLVREDGMDLAAAAGSAGVRVRHERVYLDEADPALRSTLSGAGPGALVGPVPHGEGFLLIEVAARVMPSPSDPEIRDRAAVGLVERTVRHLVDDRVRWHARL